MEEKTNVTQPLPQRVYGVVVYWLSIIAAMICTLAPVVAIAFPSRNVMSPHFLFSTIWQGEKPEAVWQEVAGGFPGGHFWLSNLSFGDGLVQLGLVLGCCCAGVGLLATTVAYLIHRPRSYGWALASLFIAALVTLAALGIYQQTE